MKQITLKIPERQYPFFMKLVRSLNFVEVVEPAKSVEDTLTPAQKETWQTMKAGFEAMKLVEQGKLKTRPVQDLFDELGV